MRIIICSMLLLLFSSQYAKGSELDCLTEALYFEARSEPFIGQLAVANVILERVNSRSFPNTVCGVVHAGVEWNGAPVRHRCAFSYWCDGKHERMVNIEAEKESRNIARMAIDGIVYAGVHGATHYHASYVKPEWAGRFYFLIRIGKHLFYEGEY
tara:strand:+ start:201 stop:665 length:465 start_codon:yes stop_codon:yes gene_type:complete